MVWIKEPWERKEAFLVRVEDGDEGDFGEVEAFAEEVDADEDVVLAAAERAEELDAFEGFDSECM